MRSSVDHRVPEFGEMEPETVPRGAAEGSGGGGLGLDAHREQLFLGIPDDLTLGEIVPKFRWKCLDKLASGSPAWLHAMRSREIYDARVMYRGLESLVVLRSTSHSYDTLCLYSTRDGFYFELPPLPVCEQGIPTDCQCVTLDGAIYALGGMHLEFCLVYVLDLAGPREWKQCASMLRHKASFTCAALDGKVYVVGSDLDRVRVSEVYDPKADTWFLIEPMPESPREGPIMAVGDELILLSLESMDADNAALEFEFMADVYNPAKNEWRVETFYSDEPDESFAVLFEAQGKLHRVKDVSISVLDMDTKRWTLLHSYEISEIVLGLDDPPVDSRWFDGDVEDPDRIRAVGDELLAIVRTYRGDLLLQSEGFGGKDIDIDIDVTWHKSKFCPSEPDDPNWCISWEPPYAPREIYPIAL